MTLINTPLHPGSDVSRASPRSMFIIVMGVSGTGKSTLGHALAKEFGLPYVEGDDLHPKANIDKMTNGVPLTDEDRVPWLAIIRATAEKTAAESHRASMSSGIVSDLGQSGAVITCSALKKYYRDILRGKVRPAATFPSPEQSPPENLAAPDEGGVLSTFFVWIDGPKEVLQERMEKRSGHFMKASMLESQLKTLESPEGEEGTVTVPLEATAQDQVRIAIEKLAALLPELTTYVTSKGAVA